MMLSFALVLSPPAAAQEAPALAAAAAVDVAPAAVPPAPGTSAAGAPLPPHQVFPSVAEALQVVLASNPRILGVGELHSTTGGPAVRTTLSRFTTDIFPVLAPHTTDLILETWRIDGRCGEVAESVASQVEVQTERAPAVKSDLVVLVEAAVAADVRPHDLALTCAEHAGLLDAAGDVQFGPLLSLLTVKLQEFALLAVTTPNTTMVLYGGAIHNDIYPSPETAQYAYGPAAGATYVELDLYQPELVKGVMLEPEWAELLPLAGPDKVVLYQRGARSWVMLLPKG
ncbi:MAG: hypothetical protein EXR71_01975 [Myxococcales bacterium]|nr:hypothetical protein [Myxococcales bacterium]